MPDIWMDVDAALTEVPVNKVALIDDADFKTREEAVTYNQAGMDLVWNFVTTAGVYTQTAVTPTTAGVYDWVNQGNGMYSIEIPASGGASINNDAEGFGWFTGYATGVLPWTGPTIGFRAAALNNALVDGGDLLDVSVTQWSGTAVAAPDTAGYPVVTIKDGTGAGEIALTSGAIDTVTAVTNQVTADVLTISGDTVAADNLELFFDGTGYDAANSTVGNVTLVATTTAVTNQVTADVLAISGDTVAADNLELFFDGTGYDAALSTVGNVTLVATTTAVTNQVTADVLAISGDTIAADNLELFFDGTGYDAALSTVGSVTNVTLVATTTAVTNQVTADVTAVSGDTVAADNLELFFDGTGYDAANSTVGNVTLVATTTAVTNQVTADVTAVSGDTVAADNLELFFDGTGYDAANSTVGNVTLVATTTAVTNDVGITATAIDNIWDEPLALHTTGDTPGQVLNMLTQDTVTLSTDVALGSIVGQLLDNGAAWSYDRTTDSLEAVRDRGDAAWVTAVGFSTLTAGAAADAVWDELRAAHTIAGSFGEGVASVQGNVTGSVASVTGAVGSVTGNVGGNVTGSVGSVIGSVGSVTGNVDGNVVGSIGSLGATAQTEVNAEVADVLKTDTIAAIGVAAPPNTPTFEEAIVYLYSALTEKVIVDVSGAPDHKEFYTTGGSVAFKKVITDAASIYTEAAAVSGP